MTRLGLVNFALVILAVTHTGVARSNEFSSPPPGQLFQLQQENFGGPWLRVTTEAGRLTLRAARIDASGLTGISTRATASPAPSQLRWSSIARIDRIVTRKRAGRIAGLVLGVAAGGGLGKAIGGSVRSRQTDPQPPYRPLSIDHGGTGLVLGMVVLGGVGVWQGGRFGDRLVKEERSLYVAAPVESSSTIVVDSAAVTTASPPAMAAAGDSLTAVPSPLSSLRPLLGPAGSPAPGALARLDSRLMRARRVRIITLSGRVVASGVRASAAGLAYDGLLAPPRGEPLPGPGRVAWEGVLRVDVPGNHALRAALVSTVILGGLVGAVFASIRPGDDIGGGGAIIYAVPLGVGLATGVGALIPGWHRVYRSRHPRTTGR